MGGVSQRVVLMFLLGNLMDKLKQILLWVQLSIFYVCIFYPFRCEKLGKMMGSMDFKLCSPPPSLSAMGKSMSWSIGRPLSLQSLKAAGRAARSTLSWKETWASILLNMFTWKWKLSPGRLSGLLKFTQLVHNQTKTSTQFLSWCSGGHFILLNVDSCLNIIMIEFGSLHCR